MPGAVDLHNHILPALDDGPADMDEALLLARDLVEAGYDTVVATPHTLGGTPGPALIVERTFDLQAELNRQQVPLTILPGAEQHIEPDLCARLAAGDALTLNHTRYLMLELPMLQPLPVYTEQLLFNLSQEGYRPVIPHPERVVALQMNRQMLYRLYRLGVLYQVTWVAFTGKLGPAASKTARFMLQAGLVHLLATDAHHPASPQLAVKKAAAFLDKKQGRGYSQDLLIERPRRLITGQILDLPEPTFPAGRPPVRIPIISRLFRV